MILIVLSHTIVSVWLFLNIVQAKPRAIVHIGPHKTSSSHMQEFLASHASELQRSNWYWPSNDNGSPLWSKDLAPFAIALRGNTPDENHPQILKLRTFFNKNLALNHNIIISSEEFVAVGESGIKMLRAMLEGYEVSIVYVYRELLSHLISLHFELNRFEHNIRFSHPFSTFVAKNFDNLHKIVDPAQVLTPFEAIFGKNSSVLLDLSGCSASGHDINYVLVCEIAGVLCNRQDLFKKGSTHSNTAYSLINSELFSYYHHFIRIYGAGESHASAVTNNHKQDRCGFCNSLQVTWKSFEPYLLEQQRKGVLPKIPIIRTHLSMLVPYAEEVDKKLNEAYGERLLHGNSTANKQAMRDKVYTEFVDGEALMDSTEWMEWMITAYREDLKKGRLCGCSPTTN